MNWFEALALAVVQGLTEFLPVSSSGHLVLAQTFFGIEPASAFVYDIVLHLGTALAALVFYRRDVAAVLRGLLPPYRQAPPELPEARRLLLLLAAATVPTAVIGLTFKDFFEGLFASPTAVVAALAVTGTFLIASSLLPATTPALETRPVVESRPRRRRAGHRHRARDLALGQHDRRRARGRPAPRGRRALLLPALRSRRSAAPRSSNCATRRPAAPGVPLALAAAGFAAAAATGYLAILLVLRWTRAGKLWQFGLYCWAVAGLAAAVLAKR